jgi:hypothetical protein
MKLKSLTALWLLIFIVACNTPEKSEITAEQWKETELTFHASETYPNPYTDVDIWVEFTGPDGEKLLRPGFWHEGSTWKVRFASPVAKGTWQWKSFASVNDKGLAGKSGTIATEPYSGDNPLISKGLLRMSKGGRTVIHANGKPFLMIADTPWALPWRGTIETVTEYARNRQERGFNTALLMSLMPDSGTEGPRSRTEPGGFNVAFEDLKDGHINQLNPEYFKYFDQLRDILIDHGIVPVFQPVFHGYGWKGNNILGWNMDAAEYARYCRYLVARYGAGPAMWLVSGDSDSREAGIIEAGEEIEKWDAYQQPTGHHYSPYCEVVPDWWNRSYEYIPHLNKVNQDKGWLDFQWCQTGHGGEHLPHKVFKMYDNMPVKAVANGEPTYEGIRDPENGAGWWQGHEAWINFTSGGTMGHVYGAGGLWNWKLTADETGWPGWANSNVSWREAIELPGAVYVGYMGKALSGLNITDIGRFPQLAEGKLCLAHLGELYIVYLPEGGKVKLVGAPKRGTYRWFDPIKGEFVAIENLAEGQTEFEAPEKSPYVLIVNEL